ncbi:MAG: hypothetical protein B6243_12470 [Anaerolineaceae bacterium 4572_5.2]|nr:MAG: hypothetical protein B6243_12470 [Anaerolineaceae bacterium 4572_5.2]
MPDGMPLSSIAITTAIQKGLAYLHRLQRPSGEFPTYTSPHINLSGAKTYKKSVYVTTFVVHALSFLPPNPLIPLLESQAKLFLAQEQERNGAWNYEGRGNHRIPCDLDDASCAVAAMLQLGQTPEFSFYALLWQNEAAPGGPYYTWIGINERADDPRARQVDALVNANILFCAGLLNLELPGASAYLQGVIRQNDYQKASWYSVSPYFLIYLISRAYADGDVSSLLPVMPALHNYILQKLPAPSGKLPAFELACLTVSLLNLKADPLLIEACLPPLLEAQQAAGNWSAWGACAGFHPNYDGSPALTTALALEALGKYLRRI